MPSKLTISDYCDAAEALNCEPAAIMAVAEVESAGDGYLPSGKIKILFERHHFHRFTKGAYDKSHPQISSPKAGGYYGGEKEYERFNQAFQLDSEATLMATSWGKFQVMGFNHKDLFPEGVGGFVDYLKESEKNQLAIFILFCQKNNLVSAIRKKNWAAFARGYNGAAYAKNDYDGKMARAYAKYSKRKINCEAAKEVAEFNDIEAKAAVINQIPGDYSADPDAGGLLGQGADVTGSLPAQIEETVTETTQQGESQIERTTTAVSNTFDPGNFGVYIPQINSAKTWLSALTGGSILATIGGWFAGLPVWLVYSLVFLLGVAIASLAILFVIYHKQIFNLVIRQMELRADPEKHNPILTDNKAEIELEKNNR